MKSAWVSNEKSQLTFPDLRVFSKKRQRKRIKQQIIYWLKTWIYWIIGQCPWSLKKNLHCSFHSPVISYRIRWQIGQWFRCDKWMQKITIVIISIIDLQIHLHKLQFSLEYHSRLHHNYSTKDLHDSNNLQKKIHCNPNRYKRRAEPLSEGPHGYGIVGHNI